MFNIDFTFIFFALIAEVLGTIGGFGSSVFFVPISTYYFDFQTVLGLTASFHVASNFSKITLFRKGLDKRLIVQIGIPAVIFVIIGGILTKFVTTGYLKLVLGLFLIFLGLIFLLLPKLKILDSKSNAIIGGVLSGFLAGFVGTGGAVRGMTMASFRLEKSKFIATSAMIDFAVDSSRTVVYFTNGYINKEILLYLPFLLLVAFFGTFLGKKLLKIISQENFMRFTLTLIVIAGVLTLINR